MNKNNIEYLNIELCKDYVLSLYYLVFDTYLGDDVTPTMDKKKKHFDWCWNKNNENFSKEGVDISTPELYQYFYIFTVDGFYKALIKSDYDYTTNPIFKLWSHIFDINTKKSDTDLQTATQIYKLFNFNNHN